jgi:hypothetical protein
MARLFVIALCKLLLAGCHREVPSPTGEVGSGVPYSMTAAQFHEFGQLSGAAERPSAASSAESLGVDHADVQNEIQTLCDGGNVSFLFPPFSWPALPTDVPAYEQFFGELGQACPTYSDFRMEGLRGQTANRMAGNELLREDLGSAPEDAVGQFCDSLNQNRDITAQVLSKAVDGADILPEGAGNLAEIGISLLIANCSNLIRYLS